MSKKKVLEQVAEMLKTEQGRRKLEGLKIDMGNGTHVSMTSENAAEAVQNRLKELDASDSPGVLGGMDSSEKGDSQGL